MTKEELLQELTAKLNAGEISREEIATRLGLVATTPGSGPEKHSSGFSVTKMLYALGAAIVIVGITIFISQIWDDIGSLGRITVTLGLGFLLAAIGSMLLSTKPDEHIGSIFHCIAGALIPGGALVTLSELSTGVDHPWVVAFTFAIIFGFYLAINLRYRNAVLTFFAIMNGTALAYCTLNALLDGSTRFEDLYAYLTMAIGGSYLLLGHAFRESWNRTLVGMLYGFGAIGVLGAAFTQVFDSVPWQMLYFILVIGGFALSVFMKSRSILVMSTIFLIAHVSYITGKYFADSIGWPISLVLLGFVFIGLGYVSIRINRQYLTN